MPRSMLAVAAMLILMVPVVGGWAAWWFTLGVTEPILIGRLGPIGGAMGLWALLGLSMAAGYGVGFAVACRVLGARMRAEGGSTR